MLTADRGMLAPDSAPEDRKCLLRSFAEWPSSVKKPNDAVLAMLTKLKRSMYQTLPGGEICGVDNVA